jgi:hypothetical protein
MEEPKDYQQDLQIKETSTSLLRKAGTLKMSD